MAQSMEQPIAATADEGTVQLFTYKIELLVRDTIILLFP
jgi:hypothetical protein